MPILFPLNCHCLIIRFSLIEGPQLMTILKKGILLDLPFLITQLLSTEETLQMFGHHSGWEIELRL